MTLMTQREAVQILWDYMHVGHQPAQADCIIGFGCYNTDIAVRAARLYQQGYAQLVIFSGGLGRNTAKMWQGDTEAERFARTAIAAGLPEQAIVLENRSANSAENLLFCKEILSTRGFRHPRVLAVHKPYMERRLAAAFPVYWPEAEVIVTSPQQDYDTYIAGVSRWGRTEADTIRMIVGDFARIDRYAVLGYQVPQQIPERCWQAFHRLAQLGFTDEIPAV